MKAKTAEALAGWRAEAARIKKEREGEPNAFTTGEFAGAAGMSETTAYAYLSRQAKAGKYRQTRKVVGGRTVSAWVKV